MENTSGNIPYRHMVEELKEKLRISEEGRRSLQQKFDTMMQTYKIKEQARYNALRKRYGAFLEEDQRRQQRNENLLQMLERIDNRSANLAARTERLALLRKHYEQYLGHIYPSWKVSPQKVSTGPQPVKIREHHEEEVSGYGTHTGSSGFVREPERYEEPRMPPRASTPRASTHLYKIDNVLPDKYRIPKVDFDMPSISLTKPEEGRRINNPEERPQKMDFGRQDIKLPEVASRSVAGVSPRDRTPREHHLGQSEFEVDQNTSGDLLNMSLSDDGVSSLTRSETGADAKHQHWETLRQAYITRQQPLYQDHEQSSGDESSRQDTGWSRQREKLPEMNEYRSTAIEQPLEQDQPAEHVNVERESFRDKIRRLKVMIQENKELERSIDAPVNCDHTGKISDSNPNVAETDNGFHQQRVRRQSVVGGEGLANTPSSKSVYPQQEIRNSNNEFPQQRVRRQSIVEGQGSMNPHSSETVSSQAGERNMANVHNRESMNGERKIWADGTPRRRMSVLSSDQIRSVGDSNDYQRTQQQTWKQGSEERPGSFERQRSHLVPDQDQGQQLETLRENERQGNLRNVQSDPQQPVDRQAEVRNQEDRPSDRQGSGEQHYYHEQINRKQSIDVQNAQYMDQSRDNNSTNQNAHLGYTGEPYPNEQERPSGYNENQQRNFVLHEQGTEHQMEFKSTQDVTNANSGQETNQYRYEGETSDCRPLNLQSETLQPDLTGTDEQYYQDNLAYGDNRQEQQKEQKEHGFYDDINQNYDAQGQGYNDNQGEAQYDYRYQTTQPEGNYYSQEQGDNADQQQKAYVQPNEQDYYPEKPYYGQQDPASAEYDPNQQYSNEYDNQLQNPHDNQQYDPQQQQYDPQQQQYDPQQQQYDPQQQQYDPQQQQYDPQQPQYDSQQQQYAGDTYSWPQNGRPNQAEKSEPDGTQEQYQFYVEQNQDAYAYDPHNQGRTDYENPQQNPNENFTSAGENQQVESVPLSTGNGQGNQPNEDTKGQYYPDLSDESTQESDRSREMPMGRNQESPSQRSIDRYRTMLGVDPNSDPAYSEVDEIEDEMAAVVASGTGAGRTQAADNVTTTANIPGQNQAKQPETSSKQLHDDSSDFDYSSGQLSGLC